MAAPQRKVAAPLHLEAAPRQAVDGTLKRGVPLLYTVAVLLQKGVQGDLPGWLGAWWWEGGWPLEVWSRGQAEVTAYRMIWRARLGSSKG